MIKFIGIAIFLASLISVLVFLNQPLIAIIITGVVAIVWFFMVLKKKQDALEEKFQKQFSRKNIRRLDKCAVFRAQESNGYSQTQGKGYLVLTDDELYFEMVLLNKILSIPAASITKVGQTKRLLGVNPGRSMLHVQFKDIHFYLHSMLYSSC